VRCYTTDGRLTIDNNTSERTLRHQAIGRKNWLFLGSTNAGPRAAVLYTILAGAKRHRIEPWAYVRELLMRLHADDIRLDEMLPDNWAARYPEAVLTHRLEESRAKAAQKCGRRRRCRRALATPASRRGAHVQAERLRKIRHDSNGNTGIHFRHVRHGHGKI
jgi:transposase